MAQQWLRELLGEFIVARSIIGHRNDGGAVAYFSLASDEKSRPIRFDWDGIFSRCIVDSIVGCGHAAEVRMADSVPSPSAADKCTIITVDRC